MSTKAEMKRALILKTATEFVLENDFNDLTLEAVAKQADISKGGLLYHFPNKEALLIGISQYIFEEFTVLFDKKANQDPIQEGKWARAFIKAAEWDLQHKNKLNAGVLASSLLSPEASKAVTEIYQYVQNKLEEDTISPTTATIIRLAIDGLYYSEMLNIAPVKEELRKEVFKELLNMTK